GTLLTVNLLYSKNYSFGGWDRDAAYLVIALFTLMEGITSSALSPNLSKIVSNVQRGTLDFILLKPLDAQVQLSTRNLTPWGRVWFGRGRGDIARRYEVDLRV